MAANELLKKPTPYTSMYRRLELSSKKTLTYTFSCGTEKNLTSSKFTLYTTCVYTLHISVTPSAATDVSRLPQDNTLKLPKHNKTRRQPLPSPTTFVPLVAALDSRRSYVHIFRLFYYRTRTKIQRLVLLYRFHVPPPSTCGKTRFSFHPAV